MSSVTDQCNLLNEVDDDLKETIKLFFVFSYGQNRNILFVTNDDQVFGLGDNEFGVCGVGHNRPVEEQQMILELCEQNVKEFFHGFNFALALTDDSKLFGWGRNNHGQLGTGQVKIKKIHKPRLIEVDDKQIDQVCCGNSHILVLTSDGLVYGWGQNDFGQVGCGEEEKEVVKPTLVEGLPPIKSIHCSYKQSFAVTKDGLVYSWGQNYRFKLGLNVNFKDRIIIPKLIKQLPDVILVCTSESNTYFLTNDRKIYYCGQYFHKNTKKAFQKLPVIMRIKAKNLMINSYRYNSSIAFTEDVVYELINDKCIETNHKTVFDYYMDRYETTYKTIDVSGHQLDVIGINRQIRTYFENFINNEKRLAVVLRPFNIASKIDTTNSSIKLFYAFNDNVGNNFLYVDKNDRVFTLGSNQFGCCGLGHHKTVHTPIEVEELSQRNVNKFFNGLNFVLAQTADCELFYWGLIGFIKFPDYSIRSIFTRLLSASDSQRHKTSEYSVGRQRRRNRNILQAL